MAIALGALGIVVGLFIATQNTKTRIAFPLIIGGVALVLAKIF